MLRCINESVVFSHHVPLKLGPRFHALLKVRYDRDDIAPLRTLFFVALVNCLKQDDATELDTSHLTVTPRNETEITPQARRQQLQPLRRLATINAPSFDSKINIYIYIYSYQS